MQAMFDNPTMLSAHRRLSCFIYAQGFWRPYRPLPSCKTLEVVIFAWQVMRNTAADVLVPWFCLLRWDISALSLIRELVYITSTPKIRLDIKKIRDRVSIKSASKRTLALI